MRTEPTWDVKLFDLFDRDARPIVVEAGDGYDAGFRALWTRVLEKGIDAEGRRTFSEYVLRFHTDETFIVQVPTSPSGTNDELLRLRQWVGDTPSSMTKVIDVHRRFLDGDRRHGTKSFITHVGLTQNLENL